MMTDLKRVKKNSKLRQSENRGDYNRLNNSYCQGILFISNHHERNLK